MLRDDAFNAAHSSSLYQVWLRERERDRSSECRTRHDSVVEIWKLLDTEPQET